MFGLLRETDAHVERITVSRVPRDVHDLVVRDLRVVLSICRENSAHSPAGFAHRLVVSQVGAPRTGLVEIGLEARLLLRSSGHRVKYEIDLSHIVSHVEPIVQKYGFEVPIANKLLTQAKAEVRNVSLLADRARRGVQVFDAV